MSEEILPLLFLHTIIRSSISGLRLLWLCFINVDLSQFFKSVKHLMIVLIDFELFDLKVVIAFFFQSEKNKFLKKAKITIFSFKH